MNMNRAFTLKREERAPKWRIIDATDKILGRLATEIADTLRGKNKAYYTPHTDSGDYVVVINCEKVALTGDKLNKKKYERYSGWRGGYKEETVAQVMAKDPRKIIEHAVRGMLPKNKLNRAIYKKLKVYVGPEHPHKAQVS